MADIFGPKKLWPFSLLPGSIADKYGLSQIQLRPFGEGAEDLDVDFQGAAPPQLTSDILQKCMISGNDQIQKEFIWDLPVSSRLEALLILATQGGRLKIEMSPVCQNPKCRKMMDIEFTLKELSQIQEQFFNKSKVDVQFDGLRICVRKPTGRDQQNWHGKNFTSKEEALRAMLCDLTQYPNEDHEELKERLALNSALVRAIEDALNEADPLVNPVYEISCPECHESGSYAIDLEKWVIEKLRNCQNNLVQAIHILARRYHWSEAEILALPFWRRELYLRLLEQEV